MKFRKLNILAGMFLLTTLTGCGYSARATMQVTTDGTITIESVYMTEKVDDKDIDWYADEYKLMRPVDSNQMLQTVEQIDREINGIQMSGWHVKSRFTADGYQKYYQSLLPDTGKKDASKTVDPLTGEITESPAEEGIDLNDGYIHTTSVANFAPRVDVHKDGFTKTYVISYRGILNEIPEAYRDMVKEGVSISIAPCGEVVDHNATYEENGVYTWSGYDVNDVQIIFQYTDLWPVIRWVGAGVYTIAIAGVAWGLIKFWTRPSQIMGQ